MAFALRHGDSMNRTISSIALSVLLLLSGPSRGDEAADALAQRFLAHLEANAPIAGDFEVRQTFDPEIYAEWLKVAEKLSTETNRHVPEKDNQILVCRWAWDGSREMTETLPRTKNVFATFFNDREGSLVGVDPYVFNLAKRTDHVPKWRPASFYFLGVGVRWADRFRSVEFRMAATPAGAPVGTVALEARDKRMNAVSRLFLDPASGVLHGHETDVDGKPYARLTIEKFARGPGQRLFPSRASLHIYHPQHPDKPFQLLELTAKLVRFPGTQAEIEHAFALELPKGTRIADRMLNRDIALARSTPVRDVFLGRVPSKPHEVSPDAPPVEPVLIPQPPFPWIRIELGSLAALALAVGVFVWRSRRGNPAA